MKLKMDSKDRLADLFLYLLWLRVLGAAAILLFLLILQWLCDILP